MGRHPGSIINQNLRKGLWSPEEDEKLFDHITQFGVGCWSSVPKLTGLQRGGKSCRLRWINYLRPDLKRGLFTHQEEALILRLHEILGNRWAQMAAHLPGRTDNEIKNFWNSYLKKKLMEQGIDPNTHKPLGQPEPVMHNSKRNSTNKALLQSLQPNKMVSTSIETPEYAASMETPEQPFDMKTLYENSYGTQVLKLREKMDLLGYNFNPSDLCQHHQIPHDSSQFETKHIIEFNSTSYLTDFDIEDMAKTIFSENSASTVSSFSFSESKEDSKNSSNVNSTLNAGLQTNNMAENFSICSGDTKHKMKSLYQSNGSSKPNHWEKHHQCSEDYSDYPSTLLSEVKEANLDVFYEI